MTRKPDREITGEGVCKQSGCASHIWLVSEGEGSQPQKSWKLKMGACAELNRTFRNPVPPGGKECPCREVTARGQAWQSSVRAMAPGRVEPGGVVGAS